MSHLVELLSGKLLAPHLDDVGRGLLGGGGARVPPLGQDEQFGAPVLWVCLPAQVASFDEMVDQLSSRLLGDSQVRGKV
jgi:hypothetical protein